jgi:subtilisin family serine protease
MQLKHFFIAIFILTFTLTQFSISSSLQIQAYYDEEIFLYQQTNPANNNQNKPIPEVNYVPDQWHLNEKEPFGLTYSFFLPPISVENAPLIKIAVLDGLVDYNSPDLKPNLLRNSTSQEIIGFNFVDNQPLNENKIINPSLDPSASHGTHVAGIIASTDDNKGVKGICPKCKIMPLQVFGGPNGSGTMENALEAIDFAIKNQADIINISWGGRNDNPLLKSKINEATTKGIFVVAAAGNNESNQLSYPAAYENVISVGATIQSTGEKTIKSNFSPNLTIQAPGEKIVSTVTKGSTKICLDDSFKDANDGYGLCTGTSMASPMVAGAIGQYMYINKKERNGEILNKLKQMPNKRLNLPKLLY